MSVYAYSSLASSREIPSPLRLSCRHDSFASCALLLGLLPLSFRPRPPPRAPTPIEIPYQRFVLPNGLTLIVHEDHKAPIVAVNVWYHVGSKNEKPGRTGFAHLFEHLMFNGTENYDKDFFGPLEQAGATDMNGTTNEDRTNYFQNVPDQRAGSRALDGIRPHGASDRRHQPAQARRAARRGAEREAPGRERALRQGVGLSDSQALPVQPPLLLDHHRLHGRPGRGQARRREGLVPDLLRRCQRRGRRGG